MQIVTSRPSNPGAQRIALAAARQAFQLQRSSLLALFDQVAEASLTEREPMR